MIQKSVVVLVLLILSSVACGQPAHVDWLVTPAELPTTVAPRLEGRELVMSNGLIRRVWRVEPNAACVAFEDITAARSLIRAVRPEARIVIDGTAFDIGGLQGQANHAFLDESWIDGMTADPAAFKYVGYEVGEPRERLAWRRVRHHAPNVEWPPRGVSLRLDFEPPPGSGLDGLIVSVHYEMYTGVPVVSKWLTVQNASARTITIDHFTSEVLALVEYRSELRETPGGVGNESYIHVETDYAFAVGEGNQCTHSVHWIEDPAYETQVDYRRRNRCLLEVRPDVGPGQVVRPGRTFESFRTFELVYDSTERERRGLSLRRMYRTIAPWVTENPLMMHVRYSDEETVRSAIDQCAEVGFEMVILTFGSGFDIENDEAEYLAKMTEFAAYAKDKGVEIGGYSLLASRSIGNGEDVVSPEGVTPTFGNAPCLGSAWGRLYINKLRTFYRETGFALLEHDGSYPGDVCAADHHPGHTGLADSRWNQWREIADFYRWCRSQGVYLNVPDWYFLAGANKTAMGYRETNWSLPRAQQVIHTRQNIFDGTWEKTPSMGWMFVPLTEYHGGGAAATIEPLREHLAHYEAMLASNLSAGVQACYRGPRLYDSDETRDMLRRWVAWYKRHRNILESDIIHGRRADGRNVDWFLHANPQLTTKGMLVVFNPLPRPVERTLQVNLYYTGLTDTARIRLEGRSMRVFPLARDYTVRLPVTLPANSVAWYLID